MRFVDKMRIRNFRSNQKCQIMEFWNTKRIENFEMEDVRTSPRHQSVDIVAFCSMNGGVDGVTELMNLIHH